LSASKAEVFENDEILLIGRMLARVLDQNSNLPILSKNSSWREASGMK